MVILGLLQAVSLPMDPLTLSVFQLQTHLYTVFNNNIHGMAWRADSLVQMHGCK